MNKDRLVHVYERTIGIMMLIGLAVVVGAVAIFLNLITKIVGYAKLLLLSFVRVCLSSKWQKTFVVTAIVIQIKGKTL